MFNDSTACKPKLVFIAQVAKLILAEVEACKSMLCFTGLRHNPGELPIARRRSGRSSAESKASY